MGTTVGGIVDCLIKSNAAAGVADESGLTALAWMIGKMPPVAKEGE